MNELVQMHNDFINLPLRRFNASEIDILHGICYRAKEQGSDEIVIGFDEIRQLAHYRGKDKSQLIKDVTNTNKKLMSLNFKLEDERHLIQFVLFPTFKVDKEAETLTVKINEPFQYLLNELTGNYTAFELEQSAGLKSSYSKHIYKQLMRFKYTGTWRVTMEHFRELLDVPKSYNLSNVKRAAIEPALEELGAIFDNLQVTYLQESRRAGQSGRKKTTGLVFTFTPLEKKKHEQDVQKRIAKNSNWEKTQFFCPKCKRPVYKQMLENEEGSYFIYGHTDFKTGSCSYSTFDYGDLLEEYQLEPDEPSTPAQERNKSRLSELLKGLFS